MNFIKVNAYQCNVQGNVDPRGIKSELYLNKDLIGAFIDNRILLKGGDIITLGKNYYTKFELAKGINIEEL